LEVTRIVTLFTHYVLVIELLESDD